VKIIALILDVTAAKAVRSVALAIPCRDVMTPIAQAIQAWQRLPKSNAGTQATRRWW
jgi:hypothetical protein